MADSGAIVPAGTVEVYVCTYVHTSMEKFDFSTVYIMYYLARVGKGTRKVRRWPLGHSNTALSRRPHPLLHPLLSSLGSLEGVTAP